MARGLFLGLLTGGVWGLVCAVVGGLGLTLAFGLPAQLSGLASAAAGTGMAWLWLASAGRIQSAPARAAACIAAGSVIHCLLTYFEPLGLSVASDPLTAVPALVALNGAILLAVFAAFRDRDWKVLNRYRLEEVVLRNLKGLGFVFFASVVLLPFYAMLMTSFKKQSELLANPLDYSINVTQGMAELFSSYLELFLVFDFGRYMLISSVVSVVTVCLTLAASIPGAYAISRLRFPGRVAFSRSILMIYMVPAIVLVIPLYALFSQLGLRDSLLGLLIVYPATTIPVALYMLQGYFRGLPAELEEAGMMDGCSRLGVIWRITLPLSLPALASVALYVFMIAWNEFLFAFMFLDSPEIFTLSRAVVSLNSSEVPRQHLMAGAVIVTLPVLVIFLWFERFLVSGLTAGSVKG